VTALPPALLDNLSRLDRKLKGRRVQPSEVLDLLADILVAHTEADEDGPATCACRFAGAAEREVLHPHHHAYGKAALERLSPAQRLQLFNLIETLDIPASKFRRGAAGIRLIQDWLLPSLDPAVVESGVPGRTKSNGRASAA
jgi:hypothetical protein